MNASHFVRRQPALHLLAALAITAAYAPQAMAQATIDQNKALAGNVTPGDTAGFPIAISQPGSYKLMSNLYVPAGSSGIVINSSEVTIDLNGFSIIGPVTCKTVYPQPFACSEAANGLAGIMVGKILLTSIVIRNGNVKGFAGRGVSMSANYGIVENMTLTENSVAGLDFEQGQNNLARNVVAARNGSYGVIGQGANLVSNSIASSNGEDGFFGSWMLCEQCLSSFNLQRGFVGVSVRESRAFNNGGANFFSTISMGNNLNGTSPY